MKILLTVLSMGLMFSTNAIAAAGYGEAGCGLGSVIMGPSGNQIIASTTNGSSYTNFFGITSGTSNCTDSGSVRKARAVPLFIEVNRFALQKESSRGQGETIASLASIMGCNSQNLGQAMRANYGPLFEETKMNTSGIQHKLENMIQADRKSVCGS